MNSVIIFVLVVSVASASHVINVGVIGHSALGTVLQGPSTKTDLLGPDGSLISAVAPGGTVVAPGVVGGVVSGVVAPALVAHAVPVLAGSGLEGQYVHDNTELLYDDGSYRGLH